MTAPRFMLVFGGTFDPPHIAHVALPLLAARAVGARGVFYIPAARSPHKRGTRLTPAHHRLAMLRLALRDVHPARVLSDEIDRAQRQPGRPSYTVETLETLHARWGGCLKMRLLIGSDQALAFDQWYRSQRIVELAEPLVMLRPPESRSELVMKLRHTRESRLWEDRIVELPEMDVSATRVRQLLSEDRDASGLLPGAVMDYIRQHHLYQGERRA